MALSPVGFGGNLSLPLFQREFVTMCFGSRGLKQMEAMDTLYVWHCAGDGHHAVDAFPTVSWIPRGRQPQSGVLLSMRYCPKPPFSSRGFPLSAVLLSIRSCPRPPFFNWGPFLNPKMVPFLWEVQIYPFSGSPCEGQWFRVEPIGSTNITWAATPWDQGHFTCFRI